MARFCPLFSSSSGNCTYIGNGDTHILVDAGVSARKITLALQNIGIGADMLSAIFVTHEHNDHIAGLFTLAVRHNIPVYMSHGTAMALHEAPKYDARLNIIEMTEEVTVGDVTVSRFNTSHDCDGSSGYRFLLNNNRSFAVCTDTGIVTEEIRNAVTGCVLLLIESNHDVAMLTKGPYPFPLKKRILSDCGHLSNGSCAELLPYLVNNGTSRIILGHLSKQNNIPDAARQAAEASLCMAGLTEGLDYILYVAPPEGGKLFHI